MFGRKKAPKSHDQPQSQTAKTKAKVTKGQRKLVVVDHVEDGLIYRTDGLVVGVVELSGVPFDMMQPEEQDQILVRFRAFLHMLTFPVAFYILTERWDLSPEIARYQLRRAEDYRDVDPTHAEWWARISQGYAELLADYRQYLDRVVYWVTVPASLPSQAQDHARAVEASLSGIHPDAQPFRPSRERILTLLANAYGHPLPTAAPSETYLESPANSL